ncbi:MAG: imidazole glycerol phosphate synthase subunit HisH [Pseudomonadota bacterium]
MSRPEIHVVDYGAGNSKSVLNMLRALDLPARLSSEPGDLLTAERLILPGVGHMDHGAATLRGRGLADALKRRCLEDGAPLLGICLGAQMLTRGGGEGRADGLGWIGAETRAFDTREIGGLPVPHMGWADTWAVRDNPLLPPTSTEARFYYAHGFHIVCDDPADAVLQAEYGRAFVAGFQRGNLVGVQFHPEKSHRFGVALLARFAAWTPAAARKGGIAA